MAGKSRDHRFVQAVREGDLEAADRLLEAGANVDARAGDDEWTALMFACGAEEADPRVVAFLLERGARIDLGVLYGKNPLMLAASDGRLELVELLLARGAKPDPRGLLGETALMCAAASRSVPVATALLRAGAPVDSRSENRWTALHHAVDCQDEEMVRLLLQHGASPLKQTDEKETPIDFARELGAQGILELLEAAASRPREKRERRKGPPTEAELRAAMLSAVVARDGARVRALLDEGVPADCRKNNGKTALMLAADKQRGTRDLARTLLSAGADPQAVASNGFTPLHCAASSGNRAVARLLLEKATVDVDPRTHRNETPLLLACRAGYRSVAELLIAHGADVNAMANFGANPLQQAANTGKVRLVGLLIAHGAHLDPPEGNAWTPLFSAVSQKHAEVAELMIEAGANVHARLATGKTLLMEAVSRRLVGLVALLLEAGVAVDAQDDDGFTALMLLVDDRDVETLEEGGSPDLDVTISAMPGIKVTILHRKEDKGPHERIVDLLLDAGADPHLENNRGHSALDLARSRSSGGPPDDWK